MRCKKIDTFFIKKRQPFASVLQSSVFIFNNQNGGSPSLEMVAKFDSEKNRQKKTIYL